MLVKKIQRSTTSPFELERILKQMSSLCFFTGLVQLFFKVKIPINE